jgi:hypothetical protein
VSAPGLAGNWSLQFLGSDPGVSAAFDLSALGQGIPVGGQASGFAVQFHWLGAGSPGAQGFEVWNSAFQLIESGMTSPVPEPEVWSMMAAGLLLATARRLLSRQRSKA